MKNMLPLKKESPLARHLVNITWRIRGNITTKIASFAPNKCAPNFVGALLLLLSFFLLRFIQVQCGGLLCNGLKSNARPFPNFTHYNKACLFWFKSCCSGCSQFEKTRIIWPEERLLNFVSALYTHGPLDYPPKLKIKIIFDPHGQKLLI